MKSTGKYIVLLMILVSLITCYFPEKATVEAANFNSKYQSEQIVNKMKTIKNNRQLILVTTSKSRSSSVIVQTFSRNKLGKWKRELLTYGITGKYGLTRNKHEGDKKAPAGKYTITKAFGRYVNPGTRLSYHRITKNDVWVDNVRSRYYNTLQSMNKVHQYSEKMNIPQYDYGFVINYNTKRIRGKGSAIFFHIARGNYTMGCTAVSKSNVVKILKWLDPKKKPVIIQSPQSELYRY